jgi:maltose O-acetyltransferase
MSSAGVPPLSPEALSRPRAAAVGALPDDARLALRWLRRGHLVTSPLLPLAVRRALLRLGGVQLGAMVYGLERCQFESARVSIGAGSFVNAGCWFEGYGRIEVGRDCLIGPQVLILTSTHRIGPDGEVARAGEQLDVVIGDGCWIGARATILSGVRIGAGAVVAAGAVVTGDCEAAGLYGGVPARRLR